MLCFGLAITFFGDEEIFLFRSNDNLMVRADVAGDSSTAWRSNSYDGVRVCVCVCVNLLVCMRVCSFLLCLLLWLDFVLCTCYFISF